MGARNTFHNPLVGRGNVATTHLKSPILSGHRGQLVPKRLRNNLKSELGPPGASDTMLRATVLWRFVRRSSFPTQCGEGQCSGPTLCATVVAGDVRALCVGWSTLRVRVSRAVADRFGKNTSTHNSSQHEKETCTEHVCATQARAHHNTCLHGQGTEKKTKWKHTWRTGWQHAAPTNLTMRLNNYTERTFVGF